MPRRNPFAAVSRTRSVPAPVGGLNARDAYAQMPPTDAVVLENWFPQPSDLVVRKGSARHVTGISGTVETLMTYSDAAGRELFAIAKPAGTASLYDVTAAGTVGAAIVAGLTNARWEHVNFSTPGGQFLYAGNAVDPLLLYDGTTWHSVTGVSVPYAITGVATTSLRSPAVWKNRVWFIEDGTFSAWYLPTQAIAGAAQELDLGAVFRLGGQLQTIFTVSIDNASSIDDYIAFLSSEGEIALYRGTDPSSAGLFGLVGVYRAGRPIGRRHAFRYGADTVLLTADGFVPLSKLLMSNRDQLSQALSYKILNLVNADVQQYGGNFGWQGILYPIGNKIIINVPSAEMSGAYQYVMNTITGAWTKFTGWAATCFEMMGDRLFFGAAGAVWEAETGASDNGAYIVTAVEPAYSYFGSNGQKLFKMVRPVLSANGLVTPAIALAVDFDESRPQASTTSVTNPGGDWDTSDWDLTDWAAADFVQKDWITTPGYGFAATIYMQIQSNTLTYRLQSIDWLFEPGGVL